MQEEPYVIPHKQLKTDFCMLLIKGTPPPSWRITSIIPPGTPVSTLIGNGVVDRPFPERHAYRVRYSDGRRAEFDWNDVKPIAQ